MRFARIYQMVPWSNPHLNKGMSGTESRTPAAHLPSISLSALDTLCRALLINLQWLRLFSSMIFICNLLSGCALAYSSSENRKLRPHWMTPVNFSGFSWEVSAWSSISMIVIWISDRQFFLRSTNKRSTEHWKHSLKVDLMDALSWACYIWEFGYLREAFRGGTLFQPWLKHYEYHKWYWSGHADLKLKCSEHYLKNLTSGRVHPPVGMTNELTPKQMPALPPTFIVISVTKMAVKM